MKKIILVFCILSNLYGAPLSGALFPVKVVICGVCRDVASQLPYSIQIMEQMGALFEDYKIVVYENNSIDDTKKILKEWSILNNRVVMKSENLDYAFLSIHMINKIDNGEFYRPEQIAYARNIVLDEIMTNKYEDFPYVIWMDMDFKEHPSFEGLIEIFTANKEWDAVFAYGVDPMNEYWDWYAFRDDLQPLGSELLGNTWWYQPKKKKLLSKQDDWYPVYSAFGGCSIYKRSSIIGCRYSALVTRDLEKVSQQLINKGSKENHPQILLYEQQNQKLKSILKLPTPNPNLTRIEDPDVGYILYDESNPLTWKMSSFVYNYPSVCEHVTFHASMILNGHDKLFINPRFVFYYGENRPTED